MLTFKTSIGDNKILATSIATFPCPMMATDSPLKFGFKFSAPGSPLYHATKSRADVMLL